MRYLFLLSVLTLLFTYNLSANNEYFGLTQIPSNSHIIEAGTNDRVFTGAWGLGLEYTTNDGVSFTKPSSGDPGKYITDISIDGTTVYVTSIDMGVSKSTNNGDTFTQINGNLADSIEVNTIISNNDRLIIGTNGFGFFYSDNDGSEWTQVYEGIRYWDISDLEHALGDTLIAGTYGGGFYRSPDNGETWETANSVSNSTASKYINDLYRDEGSAGYAVYAAVNDDGIYYTVDGGFVWTKEDTVGLNKESIHANGVAVIIENGQKFPIVAFKDNGIYYHDHFFLQRWTSKSELKEGFLDVTIAEDGDIFAITAENGVYWSNDNGEYWIPRNRETYGRDVIIEPTDDGEFYMYDRELGTIQKFTDYGAESEDLAAIPDLEFFDVVFHKNKLYGLSSLGAYEYTGNSWNALFTNSDMLGDGDSVKTITSMVIAPNDKIVGTYNTIFGAADAEPLDARAYILDYNLITNQLDNEDYQIPTTDLEEITDWIAIADNSSDIMIGAFPMGIYYRTNTGNPTWEKKEVQLFDDEAIGRYRLNDADFAFGSYYISTKVGLFSSKDEGDTWSVETFDYPAYDPDTQRRVPEVFGFEALSADSWIVALDRFEGIYYTSNKGNSWNPRNNSIVAADGRSLELSTDGDLYYFNNFLYLRPSPANLVAPQAISPENQIYGMNVDGEINFEWSETLSPLYLFQVSSDENFGSFQVEYVLAPTTLDATIPALQYNTTYYWRVRSKYFGSNSAFRTNSFTTKLERPVLIDPETNVTGVALDGLLAWEETDGADTYTIQIATDSTFNSIVSEIPGVEQLSVPADGLENLTTYYWRAKAENELGNFSDWSDYRSFKTILPAPMLVSPATGSTKVAVNTKFTWREAPEATSYIYQISQDSLFADGSVNELDEIDTTETQVASLEYQTKYYWRVAALDSNDNQSVFSEVWSFSTGLPAVSPLQPADNTLNTEYDIEFVWAELSIAEEYDFELSKNQNMSNPIVRETGLTTLIYNHTGLEDYTDYYWRVRGNANGETGTWSPTLRFRTKMLPIELLSPADNEILEVNKAVLEWSSPKGVTQYDLLVTYDQEQTDIYQDLEEYSSNTFQALGLEYDTEYFWQVRGYNDEKTSSTGYTEIYSFRIDTDGSIINENRQLLISPNPASDEFIISNLEMGYDKFSLIDATGRVWKEGDISNGQTINIVGLSSGNYILLLQGDNVATSYKKVIID